MPTTTKERQVASNNYGSGQRTTVTRDTAGDKTRLSNESLMHEDSGARLSQYKQNAAAQGQSVNTLNYYPERLHCVKREECENFNSRVMKQLMKQKMAKNQTFYQCKMMQQSLRPVSTNAALQARRPVSRETSPVQNNLAATTNNRVPSPNARANQ